MSLEIEKEVWARDINYKFGQQLPQQGQMWWGQPLLWQSGDHRWCFQSYFSDEIGKEVRLVW